MLKREGYAKRMERKLSAWRTRFEARRADASRAGAALDDDTRERLEADKVAGDAAFQKLAELRTVVSRYSELREEMETAWKTINDGSPEEEPEVGAPVKSKRASGA